LRYTEPNDANGILTTILKYAISDAAENCKSAKELETIDKRFLRCSEL